MGGFFLRARVFLFTDNTYIWVMNRDVLITDFSFVYRDGVLPSALDGLGIGYRYLPMGDIEGTSCYCDGSAAEEIRRRIGPCLGEGGIRLIDSGDYHYMTLFTTEAISEPFTLVLFDNHPDDMAPEFGDDVISCGGWVAAMRRDRPLMEEVVAVGPGGHVPYIPRRYGSVYISIDKDILSREWARTDWSQGTFTLEEVKAMLSRLMDGGQAGLYTVLTGGLLIWVILTFFMVSKALSVKHSIQIHTSQLSDGIGIAHLRESVESGLHHRMGVGGSL